MKTMIKKWGAYASCIDIEKDFEDYKPSSFSKVFNSVSGKTEKPLYSYLKFCIDEKANLGFDCYLTVYLQGELLSTANWVSRKWQPRSEDKMEIEITKVIEAHDNSSRKVNFDFDTVNYYGSGKFFRDGYNIYLDIYSHKSNFLISKYFRFIPDDFTL